MNKRRIGTSVIAILIAIGATGCGNNPSSNEVVEEQPIIKTVEEEQPIIQTVENSEMDKLEELYDEVDAYLLRCRVVDEKLALGQLISNWNNILEHYEDSIIGMMEHIKPTDEHEEDIFNAIKASYSNRSEAQLLYAKSLMEGGR